VYYILREYYKNDETLIKYDGGGINAF